MGALTTARFWVEMISALGYGVLSSIIPVFHTEAFIIAGAASGVLGLLPMSIGLAIGHVIGKQVMFQAVRQGKKLPKFANRERKEYEPGTWRARWQKWGDQTARLVESRRWGYPLLLVSAATGILPVYPVVLFAGATKMSFWGFSAAMLVGFFVRCYVLALLTAGVINLW